MDEQMPPLNHYDAAAHMYPCDLEEFKEGEIVREAFSIPVGSPTHGESVPLWTTEQMFAYAKEYAAALSQPAAAQVDSSHSAGGECGSVQTLTPGPYSVRKSLAGTGIWHITSPAKQDIGAVRSLADASLFAASGDLLEALEWLVDILPDPELDNDELQRVWTKKARAAIAKATP